ncbi:MAG: HEAT repeat domain-containing protein [Planctomycetota bacterium]|nr:HEAT repeat domain-containing protein [Planctomycetota bacterium]
MKGTLRLLRRFLAPLLLLALAAGPCLRAEEPALNEVAVEQILGRDARGWLQHLLGHDDQDERKLAMYCLSEFGPAAREAVDALLKQAADPVDFDIRRFALDALGSIGPDAKAAVPLLIQYLRDDAQPLGVKRAACEALGKIDPESVESVRAILRASDSNDPGLRRAALDAMVTVAMGEAPPRDVLSGIQDALKDPRDAEYAALAVRALRDRGAAMLGEALSRGEPPVKRIAAEALGRMGPDARKGMEALSRASKKDRDPSVKQAATEALLNLAAGGIRPDDDPEPPAPKYSVEGLSDEDLAKTLTDSPVPEKRVEAALVFRRRKDSAAAAVPALLKALNDSELKVKAAAARSLAIFGDKGKDAVPALTDWLGSGDPVLQHSALAGLAGIGVESPATLLVLQSLAKSGAADKDNEMRDLLGMALRAQGVNAATWLSGALDDPDAEVRLRAAKFLRLLGSVGLTAVPKLIEIAGDADDELACAAFDAIGDMGPGIRTVCGDLLAFLQDPRPRRRAHAALALSVLGRDKDLGARVIERLSLSLMDTDDDVCRAAHTSLTIIGDPVVPKLREIVKVADVTPFWVLRVMARLKADPEVVIPRMMKLALPGNSPTERYNAAELLGYYAPEHKEIVPLLVRVLRDREQYVARAASVSVDNWGRDAFPALEEALRSRNPRLRRNAIDALEGARIEALKPQE